MKLLRRAALNGVQLDEIDRRILIQKVEPASGKDQVNAISLWGAAGNRGTTWMWSCPSAWTSNGTPWKSGARFLRR